MQTDHRRFELRVLGSTELRGPTGETIPGSSLPPKRMALLAYLALEAMDGYKRRDHIVALFWPDLPQEAARTQLRKVISAIRETLGAEVVLNRGEGELRLDPERLWCDAAALAAHVANGRPRDALTLYRGELLEGLFPEGVGQEFHEWLSAKRKSIRDLSAAAAWACSRIDEDAGDRKAAAVMARRALEMTPDDEEGVRRLMAILDRHGDRAGALRVYSDWQERLKVEYDVEPAPETRRLARKVQAARKGESHETPPTQPSLTAYLPSPSSPTPQSSKSRRWQPILFGIGIVLVLVIGIAGIGRRVPPPSASSIAVLPLRVIGDAQDAAAALSEEIVTALVDSRFEVRSMVTSGSASAADDEGQDLRVAFVVDGGIQRAKEKLRVTLRLVSSDGGVVRWAGSYDVEERDMPMGAKRVAADAVRHIRANVAGIETIGLSR